MTSSKPVTAKKWSLKSALFDLFMLMLMLSAATFGGYFYGTHQRMVPAEMVPAGTPGAKPAASATGTTTVATKNPPVVPVSPEPEATTAAQSADDSEPKTTPKPQATTKKAGKTKYWLSSTGSDMIGYSISATVNDQPVDNFFAPGKQVDITRMVKKGQNTVLFEAKPLEDKFNEHKGNQHFALTVNLVGGPLLQENYKQSDVLLSYRRNAAETEDYSDVMHFVAE